MKIPVCLSSDRNFLQHLAVTMASILKNKSDSDDIYFYILENSLIDEDRQKLLQLKSIANFQIEYINPGNLDDEAFPFQENDRLTIATYFRLFIPELIPMENKIIYLDCDLVVTTSLAPFYKMEMGSNYIFGVKDTHAKQHTTRLGTSKYINAGVLLMNSKKMRQDLVADKFINCIRVKRDVIVQHDQDVLSITLHNQSQYIPSGWNRQLLYPSHRKSWMNAMKREKDFFIIHYLGEIKPWHPNYNKILIEPYFEYLRLTPFSDFEKSYKKRRRRWEISRIPSKIWRLIKARESSKYHTYSILYLFGIPILKIKHKNKKRQF